MISRAEALRYMGVHGEPDERLTALIDECETELLAAACPRFVWRIFDIVRSEGEISLSGCDFSLIGIDIERHLEGCTKAAITAATLSAEADRLLKRLQLSDGAKAVAADALASVLAEHTSERARQAVSAEMTGYSATWCYAAGYGDFPLEQAAHGSRRVKEDRSDLYVLKYDDTAEEHCRHCRLVRKAARQPPQEL